MQVLSTLPLKALSYYWGKFNEIPLPIFLRVPGFKLYSWIFGVNLEEVGEPDLRNYRNLSEFFYRQLKPGCRAIDPDPSSVVSPADGTVLHFGEVNSGGQVDQVKGMSYSLDALLGAQCPRNVAMNSNDVAMETKSNTRRMDTHTISSKYCERNKLHEVYAQDEEFAKINGISYNLSTLLSGKDEIYSHSNTIKLDASEPGVASNTLEVGAGLTKRAISSWWNGNDCLRNTRLFFAVVYLAPGDYHRFHSPVSWVVERRRHFAGELYSVSPFIQSRIPGLFTLNERVVLLGRWRHGMFSMTPIGATNVGSIKVHFDRELRTNTFSQNTTRSNNAHAFVEATYQRASVLLAGYPLLKGTEMGGFNLGSTIVLVFEAPGVSPEAKGGFRWLVNRGTKVRVGQALGIIQS